MPVLRISLNQLTSLNIFSRWRNWTVCRICFFFVLHSGRNSGSSDVCHCTLQVELFPQWYASRPCFCSEKWNSDGSDSPDRQMKSVKHMLLCLNCKPLWISTACQTRALSRSKLCFSACLHELWISLNQLFFVLFFTQTAESAIKSNQYTWSSPTGQFNYLLKIHWFKNNM